MRRARLIGLGALVYAAGTTAACTGAEVPRRAQASSVHVDSAIPRDEELRRFRFGLAEPTELVGGAPSRDALVERFVRALEGNDTAALAGLAITQAEFAYLYYPTTPLALPPYDLSPGLMWFQLQQRSQAGMRHALEERGGGPLGYLGYSCDGASSREGRYTIWGPCLIRRRQPGGALVQERLFGLIIGRGGRYKLVSLANRL